MRILIRLIRSEFWKMRHTLLPILHLLIPMGAVLIFLGYYRFAGLSGEGRLFAYIQVLAAAFPLVVSMICSISVSCEEDGHFQMLLTVPRCKNRVLLAKWISLALMGLGAVMLAVCAFAAGYVHMEEARTLQWEQYTVLAGSLWLCSGNLYMIHLFLGLTFGKTVSMCAGAAQSLIAALFLTGLGEGLWMFFPCSYAGRWSGYLLLYWSDRLLAEPSALMQDLRICAVITAVIWGAVFLWFYYYEGRQCND